MHIDPSRSICTVIVTVDGEDEEMRFVVNHASAGLDRFSSFPGFIAGATHLSEDGRRVIQYLQWESKETYEACLNNPSWDEDESAKRFVALMESGAIRVDVRIYNIVSTRKQPA